MFGWIGQLAQALASNPQLMAALAIHIPRAVKRLSPEAKQKLANIVRWGVEQAARYALNAILADVGNRVIDQVVSDQQVADVAKALVKRGIEVGVEKALNETHLFETHEKQSSQPSSSDTERQCLANEQAERERQHLKNERERLENERRRREQQRPKRAVLNGFLTAFGFVLVGLWLGFAGGKGRFLKELIDREMQASINNGEDNKNPNFFFVASFVRGRLSKHPVQIAIQDAAIPFFPIGWLVCIGYFGVGWNRKAFVGVIVFLLAACSARILIWLFTWPATRFLDHLTDPAQGAIVVGLSFGIWGVVIGLCVWGKQRGWGLPTPGMLVFPSADGSGAAKANVSPTPVTNLAGTGSIYPETSEICYWGHTTRRIQLRLCTDKRNYVCAHCCHEVCKVKYPTMYAACNSAGWPVWPPEAGA